MLTIPEYFQKYINPEIDLRVTPKICCPFHNEDTPSFSYSEEKGVWRCFGKCHTGGDVYDLHRMHRHLKTRQEAIDSLGGKAITGEYNISKIQERITIINAKIECEKNISNLLDLLHEASLYKV